LSEEASWDGWAPEKPKHIMNGGTRTMTECTEAHNTITSQFAAAAPMEPAGAVYAKAADARFFLQFGI